MSQLIRSLDVGVVGLGGRGSQHARYADDLGATVVGGADVTAGARSSFAEQFDTATYEEPAELYDEADPDAVFVATPNAFHVPATVSALERDIPVLVEKPVANTLENARAIEAATGTSSAFCMVGFHNRFCEAADRFRHLASEGRFGHVEHIEANYVRRRGIPGVGSWFTTKELSGGGALIDLGVHLIDFSLYLAGYPDVVDVSGTTRTTFGTRDDYADPDDWCDNWDAQDSTFDVDDSASAFIRCENGTTISLEVAWAANRDSSKRVTVRGTEGGADLSMGGDTLSVNGTDTATTDSYVDTEYNAGTSRSGHHRQDEAFLTAVAENGVPEQNTIEEGIAVQRVIDAIYRSSESGSSVPLR